MKTIIGLMLISLATTACSQTAPDQTPDKEQVAVNEIQSDLTAADLAIEALDKDGITCYIRRVDLEDSRHNISTRSVVHCDKYIAPANEPKGKIVGSDWNSYTVGYSHITTYNDNDEILNTTHGHGANH